MERQLLADKMLFATFITWASELKQLTIKSKYSYRIPSETKSPQDSNVLE